MRVTVDLDDRDGAGLSWRATVGDGDRVVLSGTVRPVKGGRWLAATDDGDEFEAADRVEACRAAVDALFKAYAGASRWHT